MSAIIPIACILGAIASMIPMVRTGEKLSSLAVQVANIVGWIGVLGGAAGIYVGELTGIASLLGIAGCAMLAVLPANLPSLATRRFSVPAVGGVAMAIGAGALVAPPLSPAGDPVPGQAELLLLYAAVFGALAAAVSSLIASTSLADLSLGPDERPAPSVGTAMLVATAVSAVWALGATRSIEGLFSWAAPLAVDGEPLVWRIPDSADLPRGLTLAAGADVSYAVPFLIVAVIGAATGAWLNWKQQSKKLAAAMWAVPGALAGALAVMLTPGRLDVSAPDATTYAELARTWLVDRGLPEQLTQQGGYALEGAAAVDTGALLPDFIFLGAIVLLSVVAVVLTLVPAPAAPADKRDALAVGMIARDLTVRAVIVGWLAWLMTVLVHWAHFGYYGVGSPSEVTFVGALTLASGMALLGWSLPRREPWGRLRALTSGLMLAVLVLALVVSLVFNTPAGLSLSL